MHSSSLYAASGAVAADSKHLIILFIHRFAKIISFLVVQVPKSSYQKYSAALDPVRICAGSKTIRLKLNTPKAFSDYFLGAKVKYDFKLKGRDEIGREVEVSVAF